jgi:hypothetical protein
LTDADPPTANMGLTHEVVCDPPGFALGHSWVFSPHSQKRTAGITGRETLFATWGTT